jgi:hypothetical protein
MPFVFRLALSILAFPSILLADSWTVSPDHAKCILSNKEAYLKDELDVIVIPVAACPETDLPALAMSGKQTMGTAPDVSTAGSSGSHLYDEVIVYRSSDLQCLTLDDIQLVDQQRAMLPKVLTCNR